MGNFFSSTQMQSQIHYSRNKQTENNFAKIDGHYVSEDNTEMSKNEAIMLLKSKEEFICKVAMGTGGGRGVQKIRMEEQTDPHLTLDQLLKPEDLIFQEVLSQSDFMASFNPDSVNTFRFLTLNINEHCTVLSSFVRMGAKGSYVDNLCSGGGIGWYQSRWKTE